jgi:hypothetical protein
MLSNGKRTWRRRTERVEDQWFSVREDFPGPKTRDLCPAAIFSFKPPPNQAMKEKIIGGRRSQGFSSLAKSPGLLDLPTTFQSGFV